MCAMLGSFGKSCDISWHKFEVEHILRNLILIENINKLFRSYLTTQDQIFYTLRNKNDVNAQNKESKVKTFDKSWISRLRNMLRKS